MYIKFIRIPFNILRGYRRRLQDYIGSYTLKKWNRIENKDIATVDNKQLSEVIRIFKDNFHNRSEKNIVIYSKRFKDIFYVVKHNGKVVGYCSYYIKPMFSINEFKKVAVIFSMLIDKNCRGIGLGQKIIKESIEEIRLNNINSILLYVNTENKPAIGLYNKMGFKIVGKVKDMYGKQKNGYKMELLLRQK